MANKYGSGKAPQRRSRPSVLRDSLFNPRVESQTFDQDNSSGSGYPDLTEYLDREGYISSKLPAVEEIVEEEETDIEGRVDLAYFARPDDIREEEDGEPFIAIDHVLAENETDDGTERPSPQIKKLPVAQCQGLNVADFVKLVRQEPILTHSLIFTLQKDHQDLVSQIEPLQQANDLNKEKLEHVSGLFREQSKLLTASKLRIEELEKLLRNDPDERVSELAVKMEKYQGWLREVKQALIKSKSQVKELEEAAPFTQQDLDNVNKDYQDQIKSLKAKLAQRKKDSDRARGRSRRTQSEEEMERFRETLRRGRNNPSPSDDSSTDDDGSRSRSRRRPIKKSNKGSKKNDSIDISNDEGVVVSKHRRTATGDHGLVQYDPTQSIGVKELSRDKVQKFTNKGEPSHEEWQSQMENKFDSVIFKDVGYALRWTHNQVGGEVWRQLKPMVPTKMQDKENAADDFVSVRHVMKYIKENWGLRDETGKAHQDWYLLKMGENEKFSTFYRKYQTARAYVKLSPETEIYLFQGKLNDNYDSRLTGLEFSSVASIVKKCQKIEVDLERQANARPKKTNDDKKDTKKDDKKSGGSHGGSRGGAEKTGGSNNSNTTPKLPWENRPAAFKNLLPLSKLHRTTLMKEGKCHKCQQHGHMKNSEACPLFAYAMPRQDDEKPNASSSNVTEDAGVSGNA